jgi:hypothetical protein
MHENAVYKSKLASALLSDSINVQIDVCSIKNNVTEIALLELLTLREYQKSFPCNLYTTDFFGIQ